MLARATTSKSDGGRPVFNTSGTGQVLKPQRSADYQAKYEQFRNLASLCTDRGAKIEGLNL